MTIPLSFTKREYTIPSDVCASHRLGKNDGVPITCYVGGIRDLPQQNADGSAVEWHRPDGWSYVFWPRSNGGVFKRKVILWAEIDGTYFYAVAGGKCLVNAIPTDSVTLSAATPDGPKAINAVQSQVAGQETIWQIVPVQNAEALIRALSTRYSQLSMSDMLSVLTNPELAKSIQSVRQKNTFEIEVCMKDKAIHRFPTCLIASLHAHTATIDSDKLIATVRAYLGRVNEKLRSSTLIGIDIGNNFIITRDVYPFLDDVGYSIRSLFDESGVIEAKFIREVLEVTPDDDVLKHFPTITKV